MKKFLLISTILLLSGFSVGLAAHDPDFVIKAKQERERAERMAETAINDWLRAKEKHLEAVKLEQEAARRAEGKLSAAYADAIKQRRKTLEDLRQAGQEANFWKQKAAAAAKNYLTERTLAGLPPIRGGSGQPAGGGGFEEVPTGGLHRPSSPPLGVPRDPKVIAEEIKRAEEQAKKAAREIEAANDNYVKLEEQLKAAETEYARLTAQMNEDLRILRDTTIDAAKRAQIEADLAALRADIAKFDLPKLRADKIVANKILGSARDRASAFSTYLDSLREQQQLAKSYYARVFDKSSEFLKKVEAAEKAEKMKFLRRIVRIIRMIR